ncbi:MAG TPA: L,D-transpeptidase [Polyangiaceae bacterium]|nr:L,D-transpeptidase [Polyangiaceae bacterium]
MANFQKHQVNVHGKIVPALGKTFEIGLYGPVDVRNGKTLTVSVSPANPAVTITPGKMLTGANANVKVYTISGLPPGRTLLVASDVNGAVWTSVTLDNSAGAGAGKKIIRIYLDQQKVEVWDGSTQLYAFDGVTGDADHPTEPGTFRVISKDKLHHSKKYDVDMHYALFFTADGKALHQYHGFVPLSLVRTAKAGSDWFGSHGCVRLTEEDAKTLYEWAPVGTVVQVHRTVEPQ